MSSMAAGRGDTGGEWAQTTNLIARCALAMDRSFAITRVEDERFVLAFVNPAFEELTGYSQREIRGASGAILEGPETDAQASEDMRLAMKARQRCRATLLQYRKDGSSFWADISVSPVEDDDGEVRHFVTVHVDVTTQVEAQQKLESVYTSERLARQEEQLARLRISALAHSLQQSLLPAELPSGTPFDFGAAFVPVGEGLEVGGDFYDVFEQRDGEWVAVIGDVMGKGVNAAAITSLARHVLRTTALRSRRVSTLLHMLNEALCREGRERRFATVAVAMLAQSPQGPKLILGLAGHPRPLLLRASGEILAIGRPGTLSGVLDHVEVFEEEIFLNQDDTLVMFTDGVTESRNSNDEFFGEERLFNVLKNLDAMTRRSAQKVADAVQLAVQEFSVSPSRDDLAVLVVRVDRVGRRSAGHL